MIQPNSQISEGSHFASSRVVFGHGIPENNRISSNFAVRNSATLWEEFPEILLPVATKSPCYLYFYHIEGALGEPSVHFLSGSVVLPERSPVPWCIPAHTGIRVVTQVPTPRFSGERSPGCNNGLLSF